MTAEDRIALILGRAIIRGEKLTDALAAAQAEIAALKEPGGAKRSASTRARRASAPSS